MLPLSLVLTIAPQPSKAMAAAILAVLMSMLREAPDTIKEVTSVVSTFPIVLSGGDFRLSSAITD